MRNELNMDIEKAKTIEKNTLRIYTIMTYVILFFDSILL